LPTDIKCVRFNIGGHANENSALQRYTYMPILRDCAIVIKAQQKYFLTHFKT